jgi:hypothetical protein
MKYLEAISKIFMNKSIRYNVFYVIDILITGPTSLFIKKCIRASNLTNARVAQGYFH